MQASRWLLLTGLVAAVLLPGSAEAGRRPFIWAYDTEIVPQGDVDLEQWLWTRARIPTREVDRARYWVWWGPVFGLSQQLELAVPFQLVATGERTEMDFVSADFRFRLKPRGDDSPLQQLVRVAWMQTIRDSGSSRLELNLVQSHQWDSGLRLTADLGLQASHPLLEGRTGALSLLGTWDAGVSYPVVGDELRLSLELFGDAGLVGQPRPVHQFVGADVAWSLGRMWVTAGVMVGLTPLFPDTPPAMARLIWAVLL
jgi:hypothetical protein